MLAKGSARSQSTMIGMGGSAKPDIAYSFDDHYRYVAAFIDALGLEGITLVGHDRGAALAWEYARRNPTRVRRLAFMEGVLPPAFPAPSFEAIGPERERMFRAFEDPVLGPPVVMDEHMFVEQILPGFANRTFGDEAMRAYRAPFQAREARRPVLAWPRQVPIAGEPASTTAALNAISEFMASTRMPVLLVYAEPGAVVPPSAVSWYVPRIAQSGDKFRWSGNPFHPGGSAGRRRSDDRGLDEATLSMHGAGVRRRSRSVCSRDSQESFALVDTPAPESPPALPRDRATVYRLTAVVQRRPDNYFGVLRFVVIFENGDYQAYVVRGREGCRG